MEPHWETILIQSLVRVLWDSKYFWSSAFSLSHHFETWTDRQQTFLRRSVGDDDVKQVKLVIVCAVFEKRDPKFPVTSFSVRQDIDCDRSKTIETNHPINQSTTFLWRWSLSRVRSPKATWSSKWRKAVSTMVLSFNSFLVVHRLPIYEKLLPIIQTRGIFCSSN